MKKSTELQISGMNCAQCADTVTKFLSQQGAKDVHVSFMYGKATFDSAEGFSLDKAVTGLSKLGYQARLNGEAPGGSTEHNHLNAAHDGSDRKLVFKVGVAALLTVPLLFSMLFPASIFHDPLVQLLLSTPVVIMGFVHFGRSALGSLKVGSPNMDVLITIGFTSAYGYSLIGYLGKLGHNYLFFETAGAIVTFVLVGNLLEHIAIARTTSAVRELQALEPRKARRISAGGKTEEIDARQLIVGETIAVAAGEQVPVDAAVVWGNGAVNESLFTGETIPRAVQIGHTVIGGSILTEGSIRASVSSLFDGGILARMIKLTAEAHLEKTPVERLADKVSAWFVPAVLAIAAVTIFGNLFLAGLDLTTSILRGIAVLVIACPCAMGLAVPTAIVVGLGRAARSGILMKGRDTLESLARVKQIIFDKTGTLTTGALRVKEFKAVEESAATVASVILGLEQHATHPIAMSLRNHFKESAPREFSSGASSPGLGVTGTSSSGEVFKIGSKTFTGEFEGEHDLYVTKNDRLIGWVDLEDDLRENARLALAALRANGLTTVLMSGDSQKKCQDLADKLGLQEVYAEQKPDQKLDLTRELDRRAKTAFVGDGVNDAAALSRASVGISLAGASAVARDSADIILLRPDLLLVPEAVGLSRATLRTIKQNLFWAFFYNVAAIPLAACGLLSPMLASLTMAFSDVIVIGNSLLLKYKKT